MAGDSDSPFTVTFGSSGRVVKRSSGSSDGGYSGGPVLGSKRSVKDRLGTSGSDPLDDRNHYGYKRQRGENNQASWNKNVSNDTHLGKGDLRFKILDKKVDLRDKLSRKTTLPPANGNRSHPSEATDGTRKGILDPRDSYSGGRKSTVEDKTYDGERKGMREPRDAYIRESHLRQELRDSYVGERRSVMQLGNTYDHGRKSMLETRDRYDRGKQHMLESSEAYDSGRQGVLGSVSSSRTVSNTTAVGPVRNSYASWTLGNPRQRSPDRILHSSIPRTLSPRRNVEELPPREIFRTYGDGKSNLYRRNDIPSPPRAAVSSAFLTQPVLRSAPPVPIKPVPLVPQYPQTSGLTQKILYPGEQPTVDGFLQSLGLEKYAIHFKAEEVDFNTLRQMNDTDLKELGIPMGPRKKIIQALTPRLRRQ